MPDHWVPKTIVGLTAHTIGGVWGSDPGEDEVDIPVFRQTEFDDFGHLSQPAGAIRSVTERQLSSRTLQEGDVLIQKSAGTPTLPGRVVRVPALSSAATFSNFLSLLRPDRSQVIAAFYFLILQHLHASGVAYEFQRGTNIRNLDLKSYLATTVSTPPMSEQRRIVDLVESIDNHIDALEKQIDATRAAREGVLSELLSNPGDDWQRANLAEVATVVVGPALKSEIYHSCNDGIPVVRGINIGTDGFRWEETVFWPEDECAGYEQFFLTEGQTIIPMDRPFRPNGQLRLAMVQQGDLPLLLNQRVAAIAAGPQISEGFLYAIACSPDFAKKLSGGLTGAYAPHLAKKDFENMSIAIPSMSEQHQITDLVQSFDEQIFALETQIDAARATRSGVLSNLLSGDRLLDESYDKAVGW